MSTELELCEKLLSFRPEDLQSIANRPSLYITSGAINATLRNEYKVDVKYVGSMVFCRIYEDPEDEPIGNSSENIKDINKAVVECILNSLETSTCHM